MTTQIIEAGQGLVTNEMQNIADFEMFSSENIRKSVENGEVVILKNNQKEDKNSIGVGYALGVKVCTSFNMSAQLNELLDMFKIIKMAGGNCLIEKSACESMAEKREKLLSSTTLPYGTIPIYQSAYENLTKGKSISKLTKKKMLQDIELQASQGVDFVILNASLTSEILKSLREENKIPYSNSAKLLYYWLDNEEKENPYYEAFDEILDILRTYDVVLCLELATKSNSVFDLMPKYQIQELVLMGELVERARKSGVQVFVDAIGTTSVDNIEYVVKTVKKLTKNAPLLATSTSTIDSEKTNNFASSSVANTLLAYYGTDFIQSFELPKTAGYFNAKSLKDSIESALTSAKIADYAKNNSKAVEFEAKYSEENLSGEIQTPSELIKNIFS